MENIIVVGGGQTAASFIAKFRSFDAITPIVLVGEEPVLPYQRPPLSKKYATGEMKVEQLFLRPQAWYEDQNVTLITGVQVIKIDRNDKSVALSNGDQLTYSKLIFATGSKVRTLPSTVTKDLEGIITIRTLSDADSLGARLESGKNVAIIGGGYIGLEAAAVCAQKGLNVTLIEASERILQRVACKETSDWFRNRHLAEGVTIKENIGLSHFEGENGHVTQAILMDGSRHNIDFAIVGIGIMPRTELAEDCGLYVEDGIVVDGQARTSDPNIYAAGDCAIAEFDGQMTRLESVPNAIDQANVAAQNAATNGNIFYQAKPWFWSDQYDVKLQIAGLNRGYDQVVSRPTDQPNCAAFFYYRRGQLIAIDAINAPRIYMIGKRIIEAGKNVPPDQAANAEFDLKSLM